MAHRARGLSSRIRVGSEERTCRPRVVSKSTIHSTCTSQGMRSERLPGSRVVFTCSSLEEMLRLWFLMRFELDVTCCSRRSSSSLSSLTVLHAFALLVTCSTYSVADLFLIRDTLSSVGTKFSFVEKNVGFASENIKRSLFFRRNFNRFGEIPIKPNTRLEIQNLFTD